MRAISSKNPTSRKFANIPKLDYTYNIKSERKDSHKRTSKTHTNWVTPTSEKGTTMTKREFYEAIAKGEMTAEIQELAVGFIAKMDETNDKRKTKMTAKQVENGELKDKIVATLNEVPVTATQVGEAFEISTQKASALLRQLKDAGLANQVEVRIAKKGAQKGYVAP